ncbi:MULTISPECIES: sll1863 family stress response protein [Maribellus]|uniref:Uncharacterized protein n=1 Tax=Maribellus comscasis TaxID=2681766 RepID=A0A6I6K136_9BACT|nr:MULTISPECIES: hypothetical protein [Maribellus]MCG6190954.1 hypothetical protein [Maribellus maritimus]QGY46132.1 hypothetical protein GM418_21415 [Maribellus comscasis]
MKKILFTLAATAFITGTFLTGCLSSSEKTKDTENKVQDVEVPILNTKSDLDITQQDSLTALQQFKAKYDEKIIDNEKRTAELKTSFADATKENKGIYEKKLAELEKRNNELKIKLADYKEEGTDQWQIFKSEFKKDMDELGKAFSDFTVSNTK